MSIVDAPFVGIAVPVKFSPISKAYWQTDASVADIAIRFGVKSGKLVAKRAGNAILRGVTCKHCGNDIEARNRGQALTDINTFKKSRHFNRVECADCGRKERDRRLMERLTRKSHNREVLEAQTRKKAQSRTDEAIANKANELYGPTFSAKDEFYKSWEWRTLRVEALKEHGRSCQCCGASPGHLDASGKPVRICVDHIKPLSKYWNLRLERTNLQILCDECNQGKGNWDETDFRPSAPDEWVTTDEDIDPALIHQLTDHTTGRLQ